jgi:hypothetical protein
MVVARVLAPYSPQRVAVAIWTQVLWIALVFIWGPKDWIYTCTGGGEYTKNPLEKYNNGKG